MLLVNTSLVPYYKFQGLSAFSDISHFVSTRHGGVSSNAYSTLNIGFGTNDNPTLVLQNRQNLAKSVEVPLDAFVMLNQVHGTLVSVVTPEMKSMGAFTRDNAICATDAMVTNHPNLCLFVMSADCVPLLFFDPVKKVIGACHAGWRGTVNKIAQATVAAMTSNYGCNPGDIVAAIGPSIGPCCYNVGGEVIDLVLRTFGSTDPLIRFDKFDWQPYFDLWSTNKILLQEAGVREHNIEIAGLCTQCHHTDFFSSRHDKGITGRFGAGIMLK